MRRALYFVLAAPMFLLPGLFLQTGHLIGSLLFLGFGVALGCAASGYRGSLPIAGGALAALFAGILGGGMLGVTNGALATAVFFALVFAERTLRIRANAGKGVHLALAVAGGALAGTIAESYAGAAFAVHTVASLVALAAVGLPLLVDADDHVAYHLAQLAEGVHEPAKAGLLRAANLRRATHDVELDASTTQDVDKTFHSLSRLGEARAKLQASAQNNATAKGVLGMLDAKIEQSVAALEKALTATMAVRAAEAAKDDGAAANVEAKGSGLEEATKLLAELDAELKGDFGGVAAVEASVATERVEADAAVATDAKGADDAKDAVAIAAAAEAVAEQAALEEAATELAAADTSVAKS